MAGVEVDKILAFTRSRRGTWGGGQNISFRQISQGDIGGGQKISLPPKGGHVPGDKILAFPRRGTKILASSFGMNKMNTPTPWPELSTP